MSGIFATGGYGFLSLRAGRRILKGSPFSGGPCMARICLRGFDLRPRHNKECHTLSTLLCLGKLDVI